MPGVIEQKTSEPSPAECPISFEPIKDAVMANCGHVFDSTSAGVTIGRDCAICRTQITTLTKSTSVNNMVIHIVRQDETIKAKSGTIAEHEKTIEQLKAELAAAKQTIKLLTPSESKSAAEVPAELKTLLLTGLPLAQQIEDGVHLQKQIHGYKIAQYLSTKFLISRLIKRHAEVKTAYQNILMAYSIKQREIKQSLQQLAADLNPKSSLLDEKKVDSARTYEQMTKIVREGQENIKKSQSEIQTLQQEYKANNAPVFKRIHNGKIFWKMSRDLSQKQKKTLIELRKKQEDTTTNTSALILAQNEETLTLFGGLKKPGASDEECRQLWETFRTKNYQQAEALLSTRLFNKQINKLKYDETGLPLLAAAVKNSDLKMIKLLIRYKFDVNITIECSYGQQTRTVPLLSYIISTHNMPNKIEMMKILLQNNAKVNSVDSKNDTALHWAAWRHDKEAIQILQMFKANPFLTNHLNHNPAQTALSYQEQNPKTQAALIAEVNELLAKGEKEFKEYNDASPPPQAAAQVTSTPAIIVGAPPPPASAPNLNLVSRR